MVDLNSLVGVPFAFGGRGPNTFDCLGLVKHILKENHGIEIGDYQSSEDMARVTAMMAVDMPRWRRTERKPGAIALIKVGPHLGHCGYIVDDFWMIHTWEKSGGVVFERIAEWSHRIEGFYAYAG